VTEDEPSFLSVEEVLDLHADQLRLYGGTEGIRDRGSLESAVGMPCATFGGEFLHATIFEMAAAYAFHIAQNQPFLDGNKRTALYDAMIFLHVNGWEVHDPSMALYDAMISFATHSPKRGFAALLEKLAQPAVIDN
jgi:death-on-curing protein